MDGVKMFEDRIKQAIQNSIQLKQNILKKS